VSNDQGEREKGSAKGREREKMMAKEREKEHKQH
jgi:hypothetical protein